MERRQDLAVEKEVSRPRMPSTATIHIPRPNFPWSQTATIRKKQVGNRTEKPNCVTHMSSDKNFIGAPVVICYNIHFNTTLHN
jgi:hypothetical protein